MADQTKPADSSSGDAGDGTDKTRLYAGKYKTPEELEAAYKEAEGKMHSVSQEYKVYRETTEPIVQRFTATDEQYDEGYGRGKPAPGIDAQENERTLARLYQEPVKTLQEIEERAVRRAEERISKKQTEDANLRGRISQWNSQNTDVAKHPDLLEYWVKRTDARLSPETRLDEAAKHVRQRIIELKGKGSEEEPNSQEYVDEPRSGDQPSVRTGAREPTATPESELAKYASERNAFKAKKRLGSHRA